MPEDALLLDLVVRWEESREAGQTLSLEELCRDCPELLPDLRERIQALDAMNAVLAGAKTDLSPGSEQSASDSAAAKAEALPELPGYEIICELGRGGMGVVYQARQISLDRLVAVKVLPGGRRATAVEHARFKAEVEAIARLQHPNLIQVFEVGEHEGRVFFSMEFLAGGNLEDRIASRPQPARRVAQLVEILAQAIHAAHERGVIHRDLKPANILLSDMLSTDEGWGVSGFGIPKISDFGLAKRIDVPSGPTLTQQILGTPSYMAPEQATGRSKQVGPGTDIYSLGAIVYRLLVGRPPFVGETPMEILRQVTDSDPVPPRHLQPTVPIDLETICLKCLHKQPAQRYASAAALADDLHRFLAGEPILARPISWWGRLKKWARRRPAVAGLMGVSGLAVILLLAAGSWFNRRLAAELQNSRIAHQLAVAAGHNLESALAGQVAASLDADFRQLEMVPQSMAALLAQRVQWDEKELEGWTRALVQKDKRVYGISVSFEPRRFVGTQVYDDYSLYVHEQGDGLSAKQLLPPSYPPPFYRDRDWYTVPKMTGQRLWSEPYVSERANKTPLLTYSCPFQRDGEFSGVVAADLSIKYFRELHDRLQKQYLGPDTYSFVISPGGTFVYHPNPRYEFPAAASSLRQIRATPNFLAVMQQMRQQDAGWAHATDFDSGRPAAFYYAKIPATGGYFVVVQLDPATDDGRDPAGR